MEGRFGRERRLLIMPGDGIEPLAQAIARAQTLLWIKMFLFSEPRLIREVVGAHHRGVSVKVMLNPPADSGKMPNNEGTFRALSDAGVNIRWTNPDFAVTHEKSMVIDERRAFIQSMNWAPRHFADTRDHCVITEHPPEVREISQCFRADWDRKPFDGGQKALLIWCNGNARTRLARFIDQARRYLYVQNERVADLWILEHLLLANARGVKIRVISAPHRSLKSGKIWDGGIGLHVLHSAGVKLRELKHPNLHAKMMLADGSRAIVGSINFTPGTFEGRRDLAIELAEENLGAVARISEFFLQDWENSRPYKMSDKRMIRHLLKHAAMTELPEELQ